MVKNLLARTALPVALVTFVIGCGGGRTLLLDQRRNEAPALRAECAALGVANDQTAQADKLMGAGEKLRTEGKNAEALLLLDHAVALYRLELLKHQNAAASKEKAELEEALEAARGRLQTYEKVLTQLRSEG
jgi:adenine-specific DNA methylase